MTKGVLTSVKLLVSSSRPVSGDSFRENIQDFESLTETIRFTRVGELASFRHRVSAGMNYKTRPDENDGFGQVIHIPQLFQQFLQEQLLDQSVKFKS